MGKLPPYRYFYDLEFIENGKTIDLVSIGIVADDGREYYAVSSEFDQSAFLGNPWLVANVLPPLPFVRAMTWAKELTLDYDHPDRAAVKPRREIANEVRDFLAHHSADSAKNELWAYFAAYDHVGLCQLWGKMIDLPQGVPMFTRDLQQEAARLDVNLKRLEPQPVGEHNALVDARWDFSAWKALREFERDLRRDIGQD